MYRFFTSFYVSREYRENLLITSTSDINERSACERHHFVFGSSLSFFFPSPIWSQDANQSFQIELKTLDIRSNSAHEDEWAANCRLSRMSWDSSPAIFHSQPCTTQQISLSLFHSLRVLPLCLYLVYHSSRSLFHPSTLVAVQLSFSLGISIISALSLLPMA